MSESNPELIMLCGIPTSGKSTWIAMGETGTFNLNTHTIISTDNIIQKYAEENKKTYDEVFDVAIKMANSMMDIELEKAIAQNNNIIWDQTNLTPKTRKNKLRKIPKNYIKKAIWFDIDLEEAMIRNQKRSGKMIPPNLLKSMHIQFVPPTAEEGFDIVMKGN